MPRTTLVTGANGFVGPHLVRALAARSVIAHGCGLGDPPADVPLASWARVDLLDPASLEAAIAACRPDAVVHLAGQSSAARSFADPEATFRANAAGSFHLVESVRRAAPRARVLLVGTGEVYGPQPEGTRVAEDAPFAPVSPYALSKAAGETLALGLARAHGLDVLATRSFAHAGPGQTPTFVTPAWAEQIAAIEAGRAEPVLRVGNLEVTRDVSDVRDVAQAYAALLERGAAHAVYNVCRGEGVRLTDMLRLMVERARVAVRVEPDPVRMRPADVPYLVGDPSRIAADTGWSAATPIERTLEEVLEEWRARATGAC